MSIEFDKSQPFVADTAANWTSNNTVLFGGEIGVELDTLQFKVGNGADGWNDLPYVELIPSAVDIAYDNGVSGLAGTTAQAALDELSMYWPIGIGGFCRCDGYKKL